MKKQTLQQAFAATGRDINNLSDADKKLKDDLFNLVVVTDSVNRQANDGKPFDPDWNKRTQRKWYPVFDMEVSESNPSGFRFLCSDDGYGRAISAVGSRLSFVSEEASDFAGTEHLEDYKCVMVISK